jgi:hypothetical protein
MYDMDEKNTVYLKANWLHQFAGNYGVTLTMTPGLNTAWALPA